MPYRVLSSAIVYRANRSANRLYSDLQAVSTRPRSDPLPPQMFAQCFADAWSVVDNLWRLNLLLLRTAGLKRTPDVEVHLRALRVVEDFRHGCQYLDERVRTCAREQMPLWGTLGWAFFPEGPRAVGKVFLMIPGGLRPGTDSFLNPAGRAIDSAIDLATLTAFGQQVDLSSLVRRVGVLIGGVDRGLRLSLAGEPGGGADALISAEYVPSTISAPQDSNNAV